MTDSPDSHQEDDPEFISELKAFVQQAVHNAPMSCVGAHSLSQNAVNQSKTFASLCKIARYNLTPVYDWFTQCDERAGFLGFTVSDRPPLLQTKGAPIYLPLEKESYAEAARQHPCSQAPLLSQTHPELLKTNVWNFIPKDDIHRENAEQGVLRILARTSFCIQCIVSEAMATFEKRAAGCRSSFPKEGEYKMSDLAQKLAKKYRRFMSMSSLMEAIEYTRAMGHDIDRGYSQRMSLIYEANVDEIFDTHNPTQ